MAKLGPLKTSVALRQGKQTEILAKLVKGNPDGSFLDLDQLLDSLTYTTTKASIQFSLRCLVRKGLAEREPELRYRDGAKRRVWKATLLGYQLLKSARS